MAPAAGVLTAEESTSPALMHWHVVVVVLDGAFSTEGVIPRCAVEIDFLGACGDLHPARSAQARPWDPHVGRAGCPVHLGSHVTGDVVAASVPERGGRGPAVICSESSKLCSQVKSRLRLIPSFVRITAHTPPRYVSAPTLLP